MKKTINTTLLMAFIAFSTAFIPSCKKDDKEEEKVEIDETKIGVKFGDAALESFIKLQLDVPETDSITRGKLKELTDLTADASLADLEDLTGLEYATELTTLHLGETKVTDIKPIAGLKKITYLRFNDTPISDLSPIKDYTTLTYFNANTATSLSDISALSKNTDLKELILRNAPIGNAGLQVIGNFTKLYRLNIRKTGITDITVLGQLMAAGALLKTTPGATEAGADAELDLRENSITSYNPIRSYVTAGTAITTNPATLPAN